MREINFESEAPKDSPVRPVRKKHEAKKRSVKGESGHKKSHGNGSVPSQPQESEAEELLRRLKAL